MLTELESYKTHYVVAGNYLANDVKILTGAYEITLIGDRNTTKLHKSKITGNDGNHSGNHNVIYGDNFVYNGSFGELHGEGIVVKGGEHNKVYGSIKEDNGVNTTLVPSTVRRAVYGLDYAAQVAVENFGLPEEVARTLEDTAILQWITMKTNLPTGFFESFTFQPSKRRKTDQIRNIPVPEIRPSESLDTNVSDEILCVVCKGNRRQIVLVHDEEDDSTGCLVLCYACMNGLDIDTCLLCRKKVLRAIHLFD